MSLLVITPSRGRPEKARECYDAFEATRILHDTEFLFVVDEDDPTLPQYKGLPVSHFEHEGGGMGPPLNAAAAELGSSFDILGFVGDDHRFRTKGWDFTISERLKERLGIAYGNDLVRSDIPTQVFISSEIVQTLGWMALPGAKHLYLDNTWATLGHEANCMSYLSDVVIEHMHPTVGKAEVDEGYARVNAPAMYEHDARIFNEWVSSGQAERDVSTIRALLPARKATVRALR